MNLFEDEQAAGRYENARPSVHPVAIERVAQLLGRTSLQRSLDVACGTGQSARALTSISARVVGIDSSSIMLRHGRREVAAMFVQGHAERLPFAEGVFDLLSVGLALHWFNHREFLAEAARVLRPGGWLLVYDSGFCTRMEGYDAFAEWVGEFRARFPHGPRNAVEPTPQEAAAYGFTRLTTEPIAHREVYDVDRLCAYLRTQSNVLSAIRDRRDSDNTVEAWLRASLGRVWPGEGRLFEFTGWLTLYTRTDQ
jgi:SAM-dependent methyltransferase